MVGTFFDISGENLLNCVTGNTFFSLLSQAQKLGKI